jgi:hypothetical protein
MAEIAAGMGQALREARKKRNGSSASGTQPPRRRGTAS